MGASRIGLPGVREPRAARLAAGWLVIGLFLAAMVLVPFGLYLWGKQIRNRLAFEVAPFELVLERAGRAMALRERALRAYLYDPSPARLEEWRDSAVPLDRSLADAARHAREHDPETADEIARLVLLAHVWDESASAFVVRAAEEPLPELDGVSRPGPVYDEFQSVLASVQEAIDEAKTGLVADLGASDDARAGMPILLALMSLPVMLYVASLSGRVLSLLASTRREQERLAAILDHMFDPVLVTDREGRVTLLNPAARSALAAEPGDRIDILASRLLPADREGPIEPGEMLRAIARAEPLAEAEARIARDGGAIPVSVMSAPIRVDRELVGAVTVMRDLSDRVRYEEKRLEADRFRSLGAMAERIAHDFGNYLEAASAATAMLERPSAADPAKRARWISIIRATFDEGRSVLAGLRTLSFVGHEPRLVPVELSAVVDRAIDVARLARQDAPRIHIERVPGDGPTVAASEQDLGRAIVNIVVNAIDAMPRGGKIEVRCVSDGPLAKILVQDEGPGIAPEDQERIFEMYYTTKGERGSGMGLTLAREVLRVHGGDLRVESAPGRGATFVLELPRSADAGGPSARLSSHTSGPEMEASS